MENILYNLGSILWHIGNICLSSMPRTPGMNCCKVLYDFYGILRSVNKMNLNMNLYYTNLLLFSFFML